MHAPAPFITFIFIAVLSAALFAGAAFYITIAEHPARMTIETRMAALQWVPSYRRATWLQAPLALISLVTGIAVWLMGGSVTWLIGALLVGSVVPVTFAFIMPTNRQLLAPSRDLASVETRNLLEKWGYLHAVRTVLCLSGVLIYLWGLLFGA
jgi:Domain of unknown function (DUF1772)